MTHHPDRGGSHEQMLLLNEAFRILFDPISRVRYDRVTTQSSERAESGFRSDIEKAREEARDYPRNWSRFDEWISDFMADWNNPENWAISLQRRECPKCGVSLPIIRIPKSFREAMWGGWTCKNCGLSIDKLGRPR
jgi:DnaJ-class molecular chaperone